MYRKGPWLMRDIPKVIAIIKVVVKTIIKVVATHVIKVVAENYHQGSSNTCNQGSSEIAKVINNKTYRQGSSKTIIKVVAAHSIKVVAKISKVIAKTIIKEVATQD